MELITGQTTFEKRFLSLMGKYGTYRWASAWAGIGAKAFDKLSSSEHKIDQIVIGIHFYQTHPEFIKTFLANTKVKYRMQADSTFHPKIYFFENGEKDGALLIGSNNFTDPAFSKNTEARILVSSGDQGAETHYRKAKKFIEEIFDRFFEPLALYSERITHDLAAAEDIAVKAITKSIDRRGNFEVLPKLKSFLYQVVHNASINQVMAEKRHQAIYERIRSEQQPEPEAVELNELEALRAELLQEIYHEIEELPDQCGRIFKMIFLEQLSNEVIAERLGLNVQTVRSQKHRAIGLIRTELLKRGRMTALLFFYAWLRLHS
jgi:RNA polymerase sigma factor (sigma-70 family)